MISRPRAFDDIPAHQNLAFFIGDKLHYNFNNQSISLYAGTRISKMLGMNKAYALSKKVYTEPRINLQWNAPSIKIAEKELKTDVTLGYGVLYKQPTLLMLYPNLRYWDFQQLNFHHYNPDLRYVNFMTYVVDITNYNLVAAKNVKKEIRLDISYAQHNFFITYFDEDMKTGFRTEDRFQTFYYNRYDTSGLDLDNLTERPDIDDLPYEQQYNFQNTALMKTVAVHTKKALNLVINRPGLKN